MIEDEKFISLSGMGKGESQIHCGVRVVTLTLSFQTTDNYPHL